MQAPSVLKSRRGRGRLRLAAAAAVSAAVLLLSACSGSSGTGGNESPSANQVLKFGFSGEPPKPTTIGGTASTTSYELYGLMHRGVMMYSGDGNVVPALAQTAKQTGPTSYSFTLRSGLKFQDGSPLTAKNVKSCLLHYADPANSARSYAGMKYIKSIDVTGDRNFTVNLSSPNSSFLEFLADPSAFMVPDSELKQGSQANTGAGPYKLTNWKNGVGLTLKKWDGYYGAKDVKLQQIDVSFYLDATARVNALQSGDVDFIDYVPWESFDQLKGAGYTVNGSIGVFQSALFNVTRAPFDNPLVRQAVAYSINRDNATKAAFFGNGTPLFGVPESGSAGEKLWSYDPAKAKSLLKQAGYNDGGPTVQLLSNSTFTFLQDVATSLQADLEAVGFKVRMTSPDWNTSTAQALKGNYDVTVVGNIGNVTDPAAWLPVFVQPPAASNKSFGYNNKKLNAALDAALGATDKATKQQKLEQAYAIIKKDAPFAPINQRMQAYAYNANVAGFDVMKGFTQPYSINNLTSVYMTDK
ncbi:ABC transporter substrate-binding protein [Streptomyces chartreusis]|uniref:ABC transporter substrate-binding protein n=1 Tax=Streptomyces chartreusis TaxID=1969 RepID=UPI00364C684B